MERALGYWREGYCSYGEENGSDDEGDNEVQRKKAHSFTDARWGGKVRALVAVTKNLKPDEHWADILERASKLIGLPGDKTVGDGTDAYTTDEDFDLNSIIELWYVLLQLSFSWMPIIICRQNPSHLSRTTNSRSNSLKINIVFVHLYREWI